MQWLINEFTTIDEAKDLFELWPKFCGYLENELGWSMLASAVVSFLLAGICIIIPSIIIGLFIKGINTIKKL